MPWSFFLVRRRSHTCVSVVSSTGVWWPKLPSPSNIGNNKQWPKTVTILQKILLLCYIPSSSTSWLVWIYGVEKAPYFVGPNEVHINEIK